MLFNFKRNLTLAVLFLFVAVLQAQQVQWNSSRILLEIEKLNTTASVLYIAAHPDDENTRLITYLANEKRFRTGYLSLTRGDGGQNLIGEEQGAYLGVIRTQELLAARRTDGGEQFFTRAVDFGYSKTASETFTKWPKDSILADMVWVIRNFRPDIIITRFPADERAGHGHHTASALLAEEAFAAAADPNRFPEQLKYVSVWQTKRLFWNNSTWWDKDLPNKIKNGSPEFVSFDVGGYNTLLGKGYGEIAAESRTNHKSQGFGSAPSRGEQLEFLELKKGDAFTEQNIFSEIQTGWERYRQGSEITAMINAIIANYDISNPEKSVDALLKVYATLKTMPEDQLIKYKLQQLSNILVASLGLWFEPVANKDMVANGDMLRVVSTSLKRANYPMSLESITVLGVEYKSGEILPVGINQLDTFNILIPNNISSSPYWLNGAYEGMFNVTDRNLIGKAENDPVIAFTYKIKIGTVVLNLSRGIVYKETDDVKGEIYKPLAVVPRAIVEVVSNNLLFTDEQPRKLEMQVKSFAADTLNGSIRLFGNKLNVKNQSFQLNKSAATAKLTFDVQAPLENGVKQFIIQINEGNGSEVFGQPAKKITIIEYDHIPRQVIVEDIIIHIAKFDAVPTTKKVLYIDGPGDLTDESLKQVGVDITTVQPDEITPELLKKYQAVIIGVRAYNVSKILTEKQTMLMQFVQEGGLVIAQYNTSRDMLIEQIGPYPMKLSRNRVTDENSPIVFNLPEHPILNTPNKLSENDFTGWVQERGIYFAGEWSAEYVAPISFSDPSEKPDAGGIVITNYGKGAFMYTGIAFFRQLPAGVPGAYRLMMNMIEYKQ
jgi:LmbE family N-acetylglucosaminyl deacetylase